MKQIRQAGILGLGALGILFGHQFAKTLGEENVFVLGDQDRLARYQEMKITSNGEPCRFQFKEQVENIPLLIVAVKATALEEALETARASVGRDTIILSVINGISSEGIIGDALGHEHVIPCVAQGMDAVKSGPALTFSKMGELCVGIPQDQPEKLPLLDAVTELFDRTAVPYTREPDILRRMWCKWMLNVGLNQVVMAEKGNYRTVQEPGPARERMKAAMREVISLAQKEGILVTEKDLEAYVDLTDTLSPEGMPSMRQDGLAGRPTEVELFSGTVLRMAEKWGLDTPVNRQLYRQVKAMEKEF